MVKSLRKSKINGSPPETKTKRNIALHTIWACVCVCVDGIEWNNQHLLPRQMYEMRKVRNLQYRSTVE